MVTFTTFYLIYTIKQSSVSAFVHAFMHVFALIPPKLLSVQTLNFTPLITDSGECHKGLRVVIMTSHEK